LVRSIGLGIGLAVLWLLLSGHFSEPLLLALGAISVVLVVLIIRRMDLLDHESYPVHLAWPALQYVPWLLKEIVLSTLQVAKVVLQPRLPIAPSLVRVRAQQRSDLGRVIFANSITLTPGTISLAIEGEDISIHALTKAAASGWEESEMNRRVAAIERAP
jgi:multicomponent Na+:H+ antiporter subunit E